MHYIRNLNCEYMRHANATLKCITPSGAPAIANARPCTAPSPHTTIGGAISKRRRMAFKLRAEFRWRMSPYGVHTVAMPAK